jgi:FtsP/CotA-like multicopper oxidase with cupredoxin domain
MKKKPFKMTRRQVLKAGLVGGAGMMLPLRFLPAKAFANDCVGQACTVLGTGEVVCTTFGLSNPCDQPKFVEFAPNALDPGFLFKDLNENGGPMQKPNFSLSARQIEQETGLIDPKNGRRLKTKLWGYGTNTHSWPSQTIQVKSTLYGGDPVTVVRWENELQGKKHLLPVDTSLHWCYSLHGDSSANGVDYRQYSIKRNGVPIVTHLHGGFSDFQFDGNPEFFYSPDGEVKGPQWDFVDGGFTNTFRYDNAVKAGNLWYHDHALGITRLNVYAGLAGFYFVRDNYDTGLPNDNLPAFPYELAYAIQDRMFLANGQLFYPAFPGDPYWWDFITDQGLNDDEVPQPSALAEFFGDHMVVNGKIWPKEDVEPRNYRMHLLNGTDSRFMAIRFREVGDAVNTPTEIPASAPILPFKVIGSDQGLASAPKTINDYLVSEPGSRYDIIFNFKEYVNSSTVSLVGKRIIMENIGGDTPFGGDVPGEQIFDHTNKIMAFDVVLDLNERVAPDTRDEVTIPASFPGGGPPSLGTYDRLRKVALFEGMDEFGRLQPLLGTAEPAKDYNGNSINWPADGPDGPYFSNGLVGPIEGSIAWHSPTTENPKLDDIEEWEIFNVTGDAHPVHLHLVNFEILGRNEIKWDSNTTEEDRVLPNAFAAAGDGTYLVTQPVVQHNGEIGEGFRIVNPTFGPAVTLDEGDGYVENAPKDMVTALPDQITRIKVKFEKAGRYVWHCHILSHEDHEMMRVLQVTDPSA